MIDSSLEDTPRTKKGRETRQRIIDAAADLIYQKGVANVSLDDLRHATGVSKSQLYHYFNDKSDLVRAVITCQRERVLGYNREVLEELANWDDLERWRAMIVATQAGRRCQGGCPLGSLANELSELDDTARVQLADAFVGWEKLIADGLDRMIDAGVLRADADAANLALGVMASLQGGLLLAEVERSTRPLEVALDAALGYLKSFGTTS
jgi:TetR/AcrR family transcriptional regulator, transcriptional repressor for nem operon